MRVLILEPNTYVGKALTTRLLEAQHDVFSPPTSAAAAPTATAAAATNTAAIATPAVAATIPAVSWSEEEITHLISQADALIMDLNDDKKIEQLTQVINLVKDFPFPAREHPFLLIGISSVMTWNATVKNSKKLLKESQCRARKSSNKFKEVKTLETLVNAATKEGLHSFVVAPGILYGRGEEFFHPLFQSAWLCSEEGLSIIGDGKNILPTLHINDLLNVVRLMLENPPVEHPYIVAVDNSNTSQKAIITTISNNLGLGKVNTIEKLDEKIILDETGTTELFLADMRFECEYLNNLTANGQFEWACETGLVENFEALIKREYITARNLRPVRIWLHGPPASGKSFYANRLAKKYHLPIIRIKDVITEALHKNDETTEIIQQALLDSANALKAKAANDKKKNKKGDAASAASAATNAAGGSGSGAGGKKGKNASGAGGALPTLTSADLTELDIPRLSAPLLTRLLKAKLRAPLCRNRGFILDGYPRTYEEALYLFRKEEENDEDGELLRGIIAEEAQKKIAEITSLQEEDDLSLGGGGGDGFDGSGSSGEAGLGGLSSSTRDETTWPDHVICLNATQTLCSTRLKNLQARANANNSASSSSSSSSGSGSNDASVDEEDNNNHNDEESFKRRWLKFQFVNYFQHHLYSKDTATPSSTASPTAEKKEAEAASPSHTHGPTFLVDPTTLSAAYLSPLSILGASVETLDLSEDLHTDAARAERLLSLYVEKKGKANNYHPTPEEARAEAELRAKQERSDLLARAREIEALEAAETAERTSRALNDERRRLALAREDEALVEACSGPMREYLMQNIIPALLDGLLDVAKSKPKDPVDHLAEYLFKYSVGTPPDHENAQDRPSATSR